MSDTDPNTPNLKSTTPPRFRAWLVQDREGKAPLWIEITGLWPTKSGTGYCGQLRKPLAATGGRLVVLLASLKPGKEG